MRKDSPANHSSANILNTILALKDTMPNKMKKLCNYIIQSYQSIGLLTVKELADASGVGTTTVMRLVQALGFTSYISMRKAIHEITLQSVPNVLWAMEKSFDQDRAETDHTFPQVWEEVADLLGRSYTANLQTNFSRSINLIMEASALHILGLRVSRSIADYFHYLLGEFYPRTNQLSFDSEILFDRILRFQPDDVMFVITFYPYVNKTIEAAQFCHERGIRIILLTDHLSCPIVRYASVVLKVEPSRRQFSIVPATALLEAIVIELGRRTADTSIPSLKELSAVLKERKVSYLEH